MSAFLQRLAMSNGNMGRNPPQPVVKVVDPNEDKDNLFQVNIREEGDQIGTNEISINSSTNKILFYFLLLVSIQLGFILVITYIGLFKGRFFG